MVLPASAQVSYRLVHHHRTLPGHLTGILAVNGLYINTGTLDAGLFGDVGAATIKNVRVTNASITQVGSNFSSGILAGFVTNGTIINTSASGNITVTNTTGPNSNINAGGLIGRIIGTLSNSYNSATVNGITTANTIMGLGGLIGRLGEGSGLVGTVTNSYSIGAVNFSSIYSNAGVTVGGLIGVMTPTSVTQNTYSTGAVTSSAGNTVAGLVGQNDGTITASFYDTATSGQGSAVGTGSSSGTTGGTFTGSLAALSTYSANWSITSTSTPTPNSFVWFIAPTLDSNATTRPILMSEEFINNAASAIQNAHQLQLMAANLTGTYSLANNINLSSSLTNTADVFGSNANTSTNSGFTPIGTGFNGSGVPFTGNFNGNGYTIDNLYQYQPSTALNSVGLFGSVSLPLVNYITNFSLTNVNISGGPVTGAAVANMPVGAQGVVSNIFASGALSGAVNGAVYLVLVVCSAALNRIWLLRTLKMFIALSTSHPPRLPSPV